MKLGMTHCVAVFCLVFGLSVNASGRAEEVSINTAAEQVAAELATNQDAQKVLRLRTAQIHSAEGLAQYLVKADASSPINLLSPAARKRFVESLRFNASGVTSFRYSDIEAELSASQAYRLLSLFGLESKVSSMRKIRVDSEEDRAVSLAYPASAFTPDRRQDEDHKDHACIGEHTCEEAVGKICMSGC
ncbi:hypothetical protein [Xanthomonas oryzae]|uniref:hypothetical protein n=1 Tax=Xanthomonas oryzae TaxID=347 RepID=UPI00103535C2|nr:hypothetical protein [Xanthomonas oryzae]QBG89441.1 hypothetical protein EYC54_19405 [Xanthomonas oryzae]QBG97152.1 hypothetical protein EYC55_19395 [Xanthomonas oryzae]QBG98748.1 hypothetical protein EYC56_04185 [Xanthomonas oryzae]UNE63304.1 hypothetical protein MML47_03190 [Xanthomonas oryzae]